MSTDSTNSGFSQSSTYKDSVENFQQLRQQLPQDAVVSFAQEVIKRVASDHGELPENAPLPTDEQITELATALISDDAQSAEMSILSYFDKGTSQQDLYLQWLGPAAKQLGVWWETDEITFSQVTVGTGRIYAIMRALNKNRSTAIRYNEKVGLFALVPGEEHALGVKMAADLFRRDGWTIDLQLDKNHAELADYISSSQHFVVGLSAGGVRALGALLKLVLAIRLDAPSTRIVVSGNIVSEAAEHLELMDIDATFSTLEAAQDWANATWDAATYE